MLMEHYRPDPAQAFAVLVRASQTSKRQASVGRHNAWRPAHSPTVEPPQPAPEGP